MARQLKTVLLLLIPATLGAQAPPQCLHNLTRTIVPGTTILVYRNGGLLTPQKDYTLTTSHTVNHLYWAQGDTFSYVYDRVVSYTDPNTKAVYGIFSIMREDGTCTGSFNPPPVLPTLTVTTNGSVVGSASTVDLQAGNGVIFALSNTPQAILIQPSVDTSVIAHRVDPPTASGPAVDANGQSVGTGAWAADGGFFYFVVPGPDANSFIWARVPLATSW